MSFLLSLKGKIRNLYLLWMFSAFLVASCLFISVFQVDETGKNDISDSDNPTVHSYFTYRESKVEQPVDSEYESNKYVVTAASDISSLYAKHALLMDADNGRVLYEKAGYDKAPMASTTKIMTIIVTLENARLDDLVNVSDYAASMPDVQLNMKAGEQYRLRDLLYSLMLESHNDSAVAIAEHVGGSVEGFAELMNQKAYELGAYNTHFVTPNGLDHQEHYTTAYDMALIASYAIKNSEFCDIIKTPSYSFHEQTGGRTFTVNNRDRFLTSYPGAIGIKTGFTGNAGYCFVGAVIRDGKHLVSVVLASGWPPHKMYKWQDTTKLMDYGINNFNLKEVLSAGTEFEKIPVLDSIEGGYVTPYTKEGTSLLLSENEKVTYDVELPKNIVAPIRKDDTIGRLTIYIDGVAYKNLPLYSDESKRLLTYNYVLRRMAEKYFNIGLQ